jgi:hypothetical protein
MTDAEKLDQLKALLQITDTTQDATLAVFLTFAKNEILAWLYSGKTPDDVTDVPARYEPTQVMACVAGFGLQGLENQTASTESAITRQFKYSNMLEFIRANVVPYAQVM